MASGILPGPVTASAAHFPPQSNPLSTQHYPITSRTSIPTIDEGTRLDYPWIYEGYQAFGKWMASEDDFFLFRRFESLNACTILWMQHRISRLETELQEIHAMVENAGSGKSTGNHSFQWDNPRRSEIMLELSHLLLHYNQYVDAFSKMRAKPRAETYQVENVVNWLDRGAISEDEAKFVQHKSDLISINSRSRTPLGRWLESCRNLHRLRIFREPEKPDLHIKSASTVYSSNQKFDRLTSRTIIVLGLVMLLAPMWCLEFVPGSVTRLGIITTFLVVFIFIMSTATINRPFEVVAATAAYAAVLMVFMQIDSKGAPESR